jgi:DNA mismatch repair protein MutL
MLDQHTINQIAAGEVVERPASVIKELIENAIDAQSSAITVEIKDGGISLIRITDNGIGIPKEQVKTAFMRHTTSKIQTAEDLQNIYSLGFRGEALPSIAAVTQLEMITKTTHSVTGTRIEIHGGNIQIEQEVGCPKGTTIIMRNLFYNTPARKKFLKKPSTEAAQISEMVHKIALGHPEISFKYINNNTVVFHTSGNNDLKNTVFHVYGKEIAKKMIPVKLEEQNLKVGGLIGKPELNRSNRTYENFYINGRYIKSKLLESAVEDAYKTLLPINKFPVVVLHFFIDPKDVDVNVHPNKMDVRFQKEEQVYQTIYNAINVHLKEQNLIPTVTWDTPKKVKAAQPEPIQQTLPEPFEVKRKPVQRPTIETIIQEEPKVSSNEKPYIPKPKETTPIVCEKKETIIEKSPPIKNYKIIGQLFQTYWVVEQEKTLYIVDQHAAHERIMYETLIADFEANQPHSQRLLEPLIVDVSPKEKELIETNQSLFFQFGFEIEEFGEHSYAIRSLPVIFNGPANTTFFLEIVDQLMNSSVRNVYEAKRDTIATMSCKAAVKAMDRLSFQESRALIEKLFTLENPYTCPHGRPPVISMSQYELEKKFHRIQ